MTSPDVDSASATDALEDIYEEVAPQIDEWVAGLVPQNGQAGICACVGRRIIGVDLFDSAGTLHDYFSSLIRGYALDALDAIEGDCNLWEIERFLATVDAAHAEVGPTVGLGEAFHLNGAELTGHGLRVDDVLVHLAAFPQADSVTG